MSELPLAGLVVLDVSSFIAEPARFRRCTERPAGPYNGTRTSSRSVRLNSRLATGTALASYALVTAICRLQTLSVMK